MLSAIDQKRLDDLEARVSACATALENLNALVALLFAEKAYSDVKQQAQETFLEIGRPDRAARLAEIAIRAKDAADKLREAQAQVAALFPPKPQRADVEVNRPEDFDGGYVRKRPQPGE